ncbi:flavodoxin domain-containing protein [Glaciecola petra]|uniref:Flavodoxin domain-containing protein n=1 Tax=Glaciecola petra TaxID=3075602 RepID=A0ABU2ZRF6_9ALTE|nr:flavodoxin domain-containing protein [Aestuariibacter sp. P117]MDT0594836.1 flavodoxin domain-containing protein [Aestuariibacter sp. P117]
MKFEIVVGSVLGASEYVAEALETMLKEKGHTTNCHFQPAIDNVDLTNILLVVTSTHGAGDLPDNIQEFADDLARENLSNVNAIIIGLGDSSYDTFCEGSAEIESIIEEEGGTLLLPVYQIDVLHHPIPEDVAVEWLSNNLDKALNSL